MIKEQINFHEIKGDKVQILRKIVMFSAWYTFAAILFMNIFIIVYLMLFVKCDTESDQNRFKCKDNRGGVIGAAIIFMTG